jgi:hypothetical protein
MARYVEPTMNSLWMLTASARRHRGEKRQEDVRPHDDARVGQQGQQQRHQQHPLSDRLTDGLRYREQEPGAGKRQHIHVESGPGRCGSRQQGTAYSRASG